MQLHRQPSDATDDGEFDQTSQDHMKKARNKRTRRKKKIEPSESQDSILEFGDECEGDDHLPDLVKGTNVYRINVAFTENTSSNQSENDNIHYGTDDNRPTSNSTPSKVYISKTEVSKKKCILLGHITDEHIMKNIHDCDDNSGKKRFSLPTDVTESRQVMDCKVEEFMNEVISSISEIGNGNPEAVRKLRGIIKRTLSGDKESGGNVICIKRRERPKNRVHFSEENITIEIPRPPTSTIKEIREIFCYFCCFGFLFPNV